MKPTKGQIKALHDSHEAAHKGELGNLPLIIKSTLQILGFTAIIAFALLELFFGPRWDW